MDNYREKQIDMPAWLVNNENYIPQTDKDTFINKSILSLLKVISRIKSQDSVKVSKHPVNATLKLAFTFILLLLVSITRSFTFVIIIGVYLLLVLSSMDAGKILKILKISLGMTAFTFLVMLPAVLWQYSFSSIMITSKVYVTVTAVGILSHSTKWGQVTSALRRFRIPDLFILVLDITIKYIVMLGEFTLNMLYSLKLRSVGKNKGKYNSLSGVAGTMFIKSKEMAEDMYHAMECRGFTGEYKVHEKLRLALEDYLYLLINIAILLLFFYFRGR